MTDKRYPQK